MSEHVGVCECCGQLTVCEMVEVAPCVRRRICGRCRAIDPVEYVIGEWEKHT